MKDTKNGNWWWRNILGGAIVVYIILIVFAPLFSEKDDKGKAVFPGRLETTDIILVSLGFLFNSGIVERLRKLQVSATEVSAELDEAQKEVQTAKNEVNKVQKIVANLPSEPAVKKAEANNDLENVKKVLDSSNKRIQRLQGYIK
ncbi:MAG: hypothetical protein AAGF83_00140 [Cyanobacteria bacterium P01_G01_bin.67]